MSGACYTRFSHNLRYVLYSVVTLWLLNLYSNVKFKYFKKKR